MKNKYDEGKGVYKIQNMEIKQIVSVFEELGITGITEEMTDRIEKSWNSMPEEVRPSLNIVAMLLSEIGSGKYDFKTGKWTHFFEEYRRLVSRNLKLRMW